MISINIYNSYFSCTCFWC